ncbi:MAG: prepilin-type N-terminal cleavage/methylation domain-containing protein [Planctomycetes bacterium]|nr:prepilin-type N-terminal cleavage/methylation domain-containing protein [Planctomycetota bacterium]
MGNLHRRNCGGFTLAEALVAGVILAISSAGLGMIVTGGMRSLSRARQYQQAAELLDRILTRIDLIGPARLLAEGPTEGTIDTPHGPWAWKAIIDTRPEGCLYDVTVSLTWLMPAGQRQSVQAQTFLNDPPGARSAELKWDDL